MEIFYRRTPPSLLERALARLMKRGHIVPDAACRIDLVRDADPDFRPRDLRPEGGHHR